MYFLEQFIAYFKKGGWTGRWSTLSFCLGGNNFEVNTQLDMLGQNPADTSATSKLPAQGICISNETFGCWRYVRKMRNNHVPMSFIVKFTIVRCMFIIFVYVHILYDLICIHRDILIFWTIRWGYVWCMFYVNLLLRVPPIQCLRAKSIPSIDQSMFPSQRDGCFSVEKQVSLGRQDFTTSKCSSTWHFS